MKNEETIEKEKKYRRYRIVATGLNPWQRRNMSDDALKVHAIKTFFDVIQREMLMGNARLVDWSHYVVSPELYEYLKNSHILDMIDVTVEKGVQNDDRKNEK